MGPSSTPFTIKNTVEGQMCWCKCYARGSHQIIFESFVVEIVVSVTVYRHNVVLLCRIWQCFKFKLFISFAQISLKIINVDHKMPYLTKHSYLANV